MYSKPLYNLFLIFFLSAVPFIYFDRAFMILCAHRAQLYSRIRLFCCISLFLRNYLFRMRLFVAGPGGWVGALWEGWQVCGARFPFFCGAMGTPRPCKRFAVFAAAGVCLVDCTPANGTPFSLYNGVRVCCRYAIRFFVPPAPARVAPGPHYPAGAPAGPPAGRAPGGCEVAHVRPALGEFEGMVNDYLRGGNLPVPPLGRRPSRWPGQMPL